MSEEPGLERAAEVLAGLARARLAQRAAAPLPRSAPLALADARLRIALGATTRAAITAVAGGGARFPAAGWETWRVAGDGARPALLSCFYRDGVVTACEHYEPRTAATASLQPVGAGPFALVGADAATAASLGTAALGAPLARLGDAWALARGVAAAVFAEAYEARFPGGVAFAMGNDGRIERLVLAAG